jgi:adenosylcobinamide-GDP ribazoletransferase
VIPWKHPVDTEKVGRAVSFFPVAGIFIGLILAGLNWILGMILPQAVINILLIAMLVLITGAMHLDGLMDTCDGLAVHRTSEERLKVMRDSRVGSFGVIGACLVLLTKFILLNNIPVHLMLITLIMVPTISRWTMVYALFAFPYARPSGMGKTFKQAANWKRLIIATVITLAIAIALFQLAGFIIMFMAWVITVISSMFLKRKFNGLTGDNYGAINEIAETFTLIVIVTLIYNHWFGLI